MRRGDFPAAWRVSDDVLRACAHLPCAHLPRHEQYVWNGADIAGRRVLVRCYHGLGDTIQFIRYAPLVRARAREVIVWVQPALVEILRGASGIDRVLPLHDGTPEVDYDVDLEIMELPHLFRSTLTTIPARVPYLHLPGPPVTQNRDHLRSCHVGVVWQSGGWDPRRSVPLALLATLGKTPGVVLHALQRGHALAEWREEFGPVSGADDVAATARAMRSLDLIVSVDSFPAHLAGALAKPVWTLLHTAADWRWLEGREDSPWYPTMRLFRQERPGAWDGVIAKVAAELRRLLPSLPSF